MIYGLSDLVQHQIKLVSLSYKSIHRSFILYCHNKAMINSNKFYHGFPVLNYFLKHAYPFGTLQGS